MQINKFSESYLKMMRTRRTENTMPLEFPLTIRGNLHTNRAEILVYIHVSKLIQWLFSFFLQKSATLFSCRYSVFCYECLIS